MYTQKILLFIYHFHFCKVSHILKLLDCSVPYTYKLLRTLITNGYLVKVNLVSVKYLFLTKKACSIIGKSYIKPNSKMLYHNLLLIDLYFILHNEFVTKEILTDRQIRGTHNGKIPDLLVNSSTAIELELSHKSTNLLLKILHNYTIDNCITEVRYYSTSMAIIDKIYKLLSNKNKFKFYLIEYNDKLLNITPYYLSDYNVNKFGNYPYS